MLHGGPPCQPFSQIGKLGGLRDPRSSLVFEIVRFTRELRPKAVLIEQVPNFLTARLSNGESLLDRLATDFRKLGYDFHVNVLNALSHGVPQSRRRAILVCVLQGQNFHFPASRVRKLVVGDVLADLPEPVLKNEDPLVPNHIDVTPDRDRERIASQPPGGDQWIEKRHRQQAHCRFRDTLCNGGGNRDMMRLRASGPGVGPLFLPSVGQKTGGYIPCGVCTLLQVNQEKIWAICPHRLFSVGPNGVAGPHAWLAQGIYTLLGFKSGDRIKVWSELKLTDSSTS